MVYALGLDLGGGSVTAAISRPEGVARHSRDVVHAVGAAAAVDAMLDRLGDPVPGRSAGEDAGAGLAALVAGSVAAVTAAEGTGPSAVVVAHPTTWGAYRVGLLRRALRDHGVTAQPLPAAVAVAGHADPGSAPGRSDVVAVLDVREEHVDVSVVATRADGSPATLVGACRTVPDLGSADVDDAVLAHVRAVAAQDPGPLTADRVESSRLRAACAEAGARLMSAPAATVTWDVAGARREVRVVAAELDARLRPRASRAIAAAADAVAAVAAGGVDRVVLVGRIATMPLLTELVAERFEAPVTVLGEDAHAVARGAARLARRTDAGDAPAAEVGSDAPTAHGRRAHARPSRRRPAGAVAVVGGGVVALGITALAVWGTAVAGPTAPAGGHVTAVSPAVPGAVVDGPPALPGAAGAAAGATGVAGSAVLGPPSVLVPPAEPGSEAVEPPAALAPPDSLSADDQQASAG